MVAVGFNTRSGGDMSRRRGATFEGLITRLKADSSVATRRGSVFPFVPTATVIASLREQTFVALASKNEMRSSKRVSRVALENNRGSAEDHTNPEERELGERLEHLPVQVRSDL
jgi:hypothetical protein